MSLSVRLTIILKRICSFKTGAIPVLGSVRGVATQPVKAPSNFAQPTRPRLGIRTRRARHQVAALVQVKWLIAIFGKRARKMITYLSRVEDSTVTACQSASLGRKPGTGVRGKHRGIEY